MMETELDLRATAPSRVRTTAFYAVRGLEPGRALGLLTADAPGLLIESLNLQLRDLLAWEIQPIESGVRTRVMLRAETEPTDVIDLLTHVRAMLAGWTSGGATATADPAQSFAPRAFARRSL